jgi:Flp pilus assembly protein TadG
VSARHRGERGSVTLLLVLVMPALLIGVTGLVFDGGQVLTARRQALDEAEQAARATEEVRSGGVQELDASRAQVAAEEYLAALGRDGDVEVDGDRVRVTVRIERARQILPLGPITVSATAEARSVRGVVVAES